MLKKSLVSALAFSMALVSSAVVLPPSAAQAQSAQSSCDAYARDYANSLQNTGADMVGGAVVGAIGGALIGRLAGKKKVDNGALIGAGVGAVGGAAQGSKKWNKNYSRAYDDCMARAYRQPEPAYAAPVPGTPAWYDYCRAKYRSFNPQTGLFLSYSGEYKPCR
jgi:hypothetical protein